MDQIRVERLPDSELGSDRWIAEFYSNHGDIALNFGSGEAPLDRQDARDGTATRFTFAHGSDVKLFGSLVGYYRMIGVDDTVIRNVFLTAAEEVLYDPDLPELTYIDHLGVMAAKSTVEGRELLAFSQPEQNLRCLHPPIPPRPGVVDKIGGTGVYVKGSGPGNLLLVLRQAFPKTDRAISQSDEPRQVELNKDDIPAFAELLSNSSLGEYRENIRGIIEQYIDL